VGFDGGFGFDVIWMEGCLADGRTKQAPSHSSGGLHIHPAIQAIQASWPIGSTRDRNADVVRPSFFTG